MVKGRALSDTFGSPMGRSSGDTLLDLCRDDTLEESFCKAGGSGPKGFLGQSVSKLLANWKPVHFIEP